MRDIPIRRPYRLPFESNEWGGAYVKGGSAGYIIAGSASTNFNGNASFSILVCCKSTIDQASFAGAVGRLGCNLALSNRQFFLYNSGCLNFRNVGAVGNDLLLHYSGGTYNNVTDNIYYYSDGIQYGPTVMNVGTYDYGNNWYIGYSGNAGAQDTWEGVVYEFIIIAGVLTQPQIQDLMYGRILPTQFDCRLWHDYRLGHARDLSGNGNHGTLVGNVRFV